MKILVLSPHTDDEVLGAGGTIARFVEEGHEVYCFAFTSCNLPALEEEFHQAVTSLGATPLPVGDFQVRTLATHRQAVLDKMMALKDGIKPDLVLVPSKNDIHQDHQAVTNEALRCFKHCSILGYEMPWNNYAFEADYFVKLTDTQLGAKMRAVDKYKSQQHRPYCEHEYLLSHARVRGIQVNTKYSETFQLIRWIN